MDFADEVRRKVEEAKNREQTIWHTFLKNSEEYLRALKLSTDDLEILERGVQERMSMYPDLAETGAKGFLKFTIEEEEFAFAIKHVCGAPYGGNWADHIVAVCLSDQSLNNSVGRGTTLINVVSEEWHRKITRHLTETEELPSWLSEDLKNRW